MAPMCSAPMSVAPMWVALLCVAPMSVAPIQCVLPLCVLPQCGLPQSRPTEFLPFFAAAACKTRHEYSYPHSQPHDDSRGRDDEVAENGEYSCTLYPFPRTRIGCLVGWLLFPAFSTRRLIIISPKSTPGSILGQFGL